MRFLFSTVVETSPVPVRSGMLNLEEEFSKEPALYSLRFEFNPPYKRISPTSPTEFWLASQRLVFVDIDTGGRNEERISN